VAAREVQSYKRAPALVPHPDEERDEARPKSPGGIPAHSRVHHEGLLQLDRDMDGRRELRKHIGPTTAIIGAAGSRRMMVLSRPRMMGGAISHEYMARARPARTSRLLPRFG